MLAFSAISGSCAARESLAACDSTHERSLSSSADRTLRICCGGGRWCARLSHASRGCADDLLETRVNCLPRLCRLAHKAGLFHVRKRKRLDPRARTRQPHPAGRPQQRRPARHHIVYQEIAMRRSRHWPDRERSKMHVDTRPLLLLPRRFRDLPDASKQRLHIIAESTTTQLATERLRRPHVISSIFRRYSATRDRHQGDRRFK